MEEGKKIVAKKDVLKLEEFKKFIRFCSHCSMCREECPMYQVTHKESAYPGGKLRALKTYSKENFKIDKELINAFGTCMMCQRCEQDCPASFNYVEMMEKLRECTMNMTAMPIKNQEKFSIYTQQNKNPYGEPWENREDWISKEINRIDQGENAYFVGCTSSYREQEAAIHTAKILSKIIKEGIVILGSEEYCCGSPLIRTGQIDIAHITKKAAFISNVRDLVLENVKNLQKKGVKRLIFNCSGCYKTVKQDWPKYYGKKLPIDIIHLTELLASKIQEGSITLKPLNKRVTYHDPCHLGRHLGIYEEPRAIIKAIPSINLVELTNNREKADCCGAGGGVKAGFPEEAINIAERRIKQAEEIGCEMIITACVFCKSNLSAAKTRMKSKVKILNIEDLVYQLLK